MEEIKPNEDGINHINVYTKGKTELGKMLSNMYKSPTKFYFENENLTLNTIEGFWYFLIIYYGSGIKEYSLLDLSGFKAKEEGKIKIKELNINSLEIKNEEYFREEIKKALKEKVKQNKRILSEISYSNLIFKHYYFYGKEENAKVIEKNEYDWILEVFEEIRKKMKIFLKNKEIK